MTISVFLAMISAALLSGCVSHRATERTPTTSTMGETTSQAPSDDATVPEELLSARPIAFFASGESELDDAGREFAWQLAVAMQTEPSLMVTLIGYADPRGDGEQNVRLAEKRAERVRDELLARGIGPERIEIVAVGADTEFEADDELEPVLKFARRVEAELSPTSAE